MQITREDIDKFDGVKTENKIMEFLLEQMKGEYFSDGENQLDLVRNQNLEKSHI